MNKMPIARKSKEVKVSPLSITSPRQPRLPLSIQGISQLLRKSDDTAQKDFGPSMEWTVGQTPFVLYCAEHDPQGMLQHAVAAIQITHKMLWRKPGFRQDSQVAFVIEGVGSFEVSPRSNADEIEVFLHARSVCMEIHLPSPDLWPSLGLAWLLRPPTSGKTAELADHMTKHPVARLQGPFMAGGRYTSWHAAVAHAGLAFEG